ncbi:MAG: hypothetical protein RR685_09305, partial [Hungatella sp.]
MVTILDIDLDFFVTPIKYWGTSNNRIPEGEATAENIDAAMNYLETHCRLQARTTPGAVFEHHDELFDYALKQFTEPIHLIHLDAHADIGGGLTKCWDYVCTKYTHLDQHMRKFPKRGNEGLNCGNFLVFLAGVGLLERVTFVSHSDWRDDYNPIYMKDFDPTSEELQLKRFSAQIIKDDDLCTPLYDLPHEVEQSIPFVRVPRHDFYSDIVPDKIILTRSPGYTPASADSLFNAISQRI